MQAHATEAAALLDGCPLAGKHLCVIKTRDPTIRDVKRAEDYSNSALLRYIDVDVDSAAYRCNLNKPSPCLRVSNLPAASLLSEGTSRSRAVVLVLHVSRCVPLLRFEAE